MRDFGVLTWNLNWISTTKWHFSRNVNCKQKSLGFETSLQKSMFFFWKFQFHQTMFSSGRFFLCCCWFFVFVLVWFGFFFTLPALCLFVCCAAWGLDISSRHTDVCTRDTLEIPYESPEIHLHTDFLRNLNHYRLINCFNLGKCSRCQMSSKQKLNLHTEEEWGLQGLLFISIQNYTSLSKGWLCKTSERKSQMALWKH